MEVAHPEVEGGVLRARGTQIGVSYELRYEVDERRLRVEVVGVRALETELGEADFFDLEFSPLFNSLPTIRYALQRGGEPRAFTMSFVSVPQLSVTRSQQRYEPLAPGRLSFRSGSFAAELELDEEGFVVRYPGLAERLV